MHEIEFVVRTSTSRTNHDLKAKWFKRKMDVRTSLSLEIFQSQLQTPRVCDAMGAAPPLMLVNNNLPAVAWQVITTALLPYCWFI